MFPKKEQNRLDYKQIYDHMFCVVNHAKHQGNGKHKKNKDILASMVTEGRQGKARINITNSK